VKIEDLKKITPWQEMKVIEKSRELRMVFADMAKRIEVPALRETDGNDTQAIFHYFDTCGSADWYVFEADLETGEGFGFVTFSGDFDDPDAEFGYIDLFDLAKSARINLNLHYNVDGKSGITKKQIHLQRYGDREEAVASRIFGIFEKPERRQIEDMQASLATKKLLIRSRKWQMQYR